MRTLTIGLISAVALAAGVLVVREVRDGEQLVSRTGDIPAGETQPATISLDRIRALGF